MAKIIINRDKFKVDDRELQQGTLSIGRKKDNAVQIDDSMVSSHHAQIVTVFDSSYVEDLGSTNGTFVNGEKTNTHTLHNGDIITIGKYQLLFQTDNSTAKMDANATMIMDVSQLEELTKKAKQGKSANAALSSKKSAHKIDKSSPQNPSPVAGKPALKVHKNSEKNKEKTNKLPDLGESKILLKRTEHPAVSPAMRPLRKSDTSPLPSLKVIALAALATIATFFLLILFYK